MSSGGAVFILLSNEGRQDKIITAPDFLIERINYFISKKTAAGLEDTMPTLNEIESSHIIFPSAHFKPFAAIAYEYTKISATNPTLGSDVSLSIPQAGDFFCDMVVHLILTTATPTATGTAADASDVPMVRWCDWPGERIFSKVAFEINGSILDEYTYESNVFRRQFRIGADKMVGYKRMMGQQIEKTVDYQYSVATSTAAPLSSIATLGIKDGHQVYKTTQPNLELFIPLDFWFSDVRLAFPSVSVPYGQRFMKFTIAGKDDLVRTIINPAATTALTAPTIETPLITKFDMYMNNIFVNPQIHDIFISQIGFSLIRVHKKHSAQVNKTSDSILLNQLKWPVEYMFVAIRPNANKTINTDTASLGDNSSVIDARMEDWHRMSQVTTTEAAAATVNGAAAGYILKTETNHVTSLKVTAQGTNLYNETPGTFFNAYKPFNFGGSNINTPTDPGVFLVNFCFYPGTYQPSGHINVSRSREFYIEYVSTYITSTTPGELIIEGSCFNFLLITDGSAILRFAA